VRNIQGELAEYNPPSEEVKGVLEKHKTVAIVGLSPKPERDSHKVGRYLKEHGYRIVPVNPGQKTILGERCYSNLRAIPFPVDIVDIFRRSEHIPPVVEEAVAIGAKVVWMQSGIVHHQAAARAHEAGLGVIMDKCIKIEHVNMYKQNFSTS
jgi:predicted CoA-binding protein